MAGTSGTHALLWAPAVLGYRMIDLGTLPGGSVSAALGVNLAGTVVGVSDTTNSMQELATVWRPVPWADAAPVARRGHRGHAVPASARRGHAPGDAARYRGIGR